MTSCLAQMDEIPLILFLVAIFDYLRVADFNCIQINDINVKVNVFAS